MGFPDLLPLPHKQDIQPPKKDDDLKDISRAVKELVESHNEMQRILKQDVNLLMRPAPRAKPDGGYGQSDAGYGLPVDLLRARMINGALTKFKDGLVVSDGDDTTQIKVTFNWLGVGNMLLGNGGGTTLTADLDTAGVGGLDTGAKAATTWYAIHVITSDDTEAVEDLTFAPPTYRMANKQDLLLSTSATAPLLPAGYNKFRRVGWGRTDASSNFYRIVNIGDWTIWNEDVNSTPFLVLAGGAATSYAAVSLAAVVPPTSRRVLCGVTELNPGAGSFGVYSRPTGSNWSGGNSDNIYMAGIWNTLTHASPSSSTSVEADIANLLLNSENMSLTWTLPSSAISNTISSAAGAFSAADKLNTQLELNVHDYHLCQQVGTNKDASSSMVFSVYFKEGSTHRGFVWLEVYDGVSAINSGSYVRQMFETGTPALGAYTAAAGTGWAKVSAAVTTANLLFSAGPPAGWMRLSLIVTTGTETTWGVRVGFAKADNFTEANVHYAVASGACTHILAQATLQMGTQTLKNHVVTEDIKAGPQAITTTTTTTTTHNGGSVYFNGGGVRTELVCDAAQSIDYWVYSGDTVSIFVLGYYDPV